MQNQIELIMARLDKLYRDLPLEYAGYVLTAIQDIESIVYADRNETAYSEQYDAYYYKTTKEWTEPKCDDPTCEYCSNRPPKAP